MSRRETPNGSSGQEASDIDFIPLDEFHVRLMHAWLSHGEVLRWYGRCLRTEDELRQKYLIEQPRGGTHCRIILHNSHPIGYLQYSRVADYPDYYSLVSAEPGDFCLACSSVRVTA